MRAFFLTFFVTAMQLSYILHAQQEKIDPAREKNFIYEVKNMDEFIDRFNDNSSTMLRKYLAHGGRSAKFGRKEMVATLFNHPDAWKNNPVAQRFLSQVLDPEHPQGLQFNDSNWFAELTCVFNLDGRSREILLVMQINMGENKGAKWMIVGIGDSPVFRNEPLKLKDSAAAHQKPNDASLLAPTDYATNFLSLHQIFKPSMNPASYFSPGLLNSERADKFIELIRKGTLVFSYTRDVRFHFFRIPGYVFIVEHFTRPSTNSGWLITEIQDVPEDEVDDRKEKLLKHTL